MPLGHPTLFGIGSPLKIVANGWPLLARSGGIGVYTREFLQRFVQFDTDNEYFLYGIGRRLKKASPEELAAHHPPTGGQRIVWNLARRAFPLLRNSKFGDWAANVRARCAERSLARSGTDLFWGTWFFGLFHPAFKTVVTIHDLSYQHYPETIQPVMYRALTAQLREHAHRADMVLADSFHTQRDITSFLGIDATKVEVVYPGVSERYLPIPDRSYLHEVQLRRGLPDQFLLFVGTVEPRKNIPVLIEAFDLLCREPAFRHGLVIAGGKGWNDERILAAVDRSGHRDRIVCTGYVPDAEMPALYNLASVFVMPSLYEGFGLPVVEALACGTPVVASQVSSLPELVGDAGLMFDPQSPEQLADAVRRLLADETLRRSFREHGFVQARKFSWDAAARQALSVFNRVTGRTDNDSIVSQSPVTVMPVWPPP